MRYSSSNMASLNSSFSKNPKNVNGFSNLSSSSLINSFNSLDLNKNIAQTSHQNSDSILIDSSKKDSTSVSEISNDKLGKIVHQLILPF